MSSLPDRRRFLLGCAGTVVLGVAPRRALPLTRQPFTLGVASGYPSPQGIALWTRLAPEPLAPGGGLDPVPIEVRWEIATDEHFGHVCDSGRALALPAWAHSVHVESERLAPDREYCYRFHAAGATSPTGCFRTAPAPQALPAALRLALVSCQQYEQGWYAAYRHLVQDAPALVLHVGDYIYESSWGDNLVRRHEGPEPVTLEQYRARYACYKLDADLQAAHAACAWVLTWDDHEVDNDYANLASEELVPPDVMRARRLAAYRAYYEHQPLRRAMRPHGHGLALHTRFDYGRLARFHVLDTRQFRSVQPCPPAGEGGAASIPDCPERHAESATMLGAAQERWLAAGLRARDTRWHFIAQTTRMAAGDSAPGPDLSFYSDAWDGYTAARRRLLGAVRDARVANPVVLGGDVHSFWVNDLKLDDAPADAPALATEFVTTSVTSQPPPEEMVQNVVRESPHVRFGTGAYRGYLRLDLRPSRLTADLRALDDVKRVDSGCRTLGSWSVAAGRPGAERA